jgi:hypothetical protein
MNDPKPAPRNSPEGDHAMAIRGAWYFALPSAPLTGRAGRRPYALRLAGCVSVTARRRRCEAAATSSTAWLKADSFAGDGRR